LGRGREGYIGDDGPTERERRGGNLIGGIVGRGRDFCRTNVKLLAIPLLNPGLKVMVPFEGEFLNNDAF